MRLLLKFLNKKECNQEKFALIGVKIYIVITKQYDSGANVHKQVSGIKEISDIY